MLHAITAVAHESAAVGNALEFPVEIENTRAKEKDKSTSIQRSISFLIPKKDVPSGTRSILRQRSTGVFPSSPSGSKSYAYHQQAPSLEIAPIHLQLQDSFTWPDRGFAISIWFQIKLNQCCSSVHRYTEDSFPGSSFKRGFKNPASCLSDVTIECLDEVPSFHLCSFGARNALFEVWVNKNPTSLEYR